MISYKGLDEAVVLHALYHGTSPLGLGMLHNCPGFSVENARSWFERGTMGASGEFAPDLGYNRIPSGDTLKLDYVAGRPIKVVFNLVNKTIDHERLYDRDAGEGACARIIEDLLAKQN